MEGLTLPVILDLITKGLAVGGTIIAIWKSWKAGQYKNAFDLSEKTLEDIIVAIELLPFDSETMKKIKQNIKSVAETTGSQKEKLAKMVEVVSKFLKDNGITGNGNNAMMRGVKAILEARANRNGD